MTSELIKYGRSESVPRVSVIVPAYNAQRVLEHAVESVLNQTCSDWELILVNDGSLDETGSICEKYKKSNPKIKVIHQENAGVSVARNNGISISEGEKIAFLDADDWYAPNFLECMLHALDSSAADCVSCGHINAFDDGHETYEMSALPRGVYSEESIKAGIVLPLLSDRIRRDLFNGYVWRYLFDKKTIIDNGIEFSGAYLEDELFLIEYFSCAGTLCVIDDALYYYYQNANSVTRSYLPKYERTFFTSLEIKRRLIARYSIPVPEYWEYNTCWAGLFIAAANLFAPGNRSGFLRKVRDLRGICNMPKFRAAIQNYHPADMSRNKTVVAALIRARLYFLLGLLYVIKNRNR